MSAVMNPAGVPLSARKIHLVCVRRAFPWLKVQLGSERPHNQRQAPEEQMEVAIAVQ